MSMPKIPDINPHININRDDAINIIITSIAMEELSLAHILNAEGEKLQYVLGTLEGKNPGEITFCDIMAVNNSINKTLKEVIKAEMLLELKLEDAIELDKSGADCRKKISGQKIWKDGNNIFKKRPDYVEISLLRNGVAYGEPIKVSGTGDGYFCFTCLPLKDSDGHDYIYTVDEPVVPTGYRKTIDGFNITNTALPGTRTIDVTKTWVDNNNAEDTRPDEITLKLLQNDVQFKTEKMAKDATTFSFRDVPQFDQEGTPYIYTVEEDETGLEDYTRKITGFNITNTLNP